MALILLPALGGNAPEARTGSIDVRIEGLRSTHGLIRICLTREPRFFPYCDKDKTSLRINVSADQSRPIAFSDVAAGDYAITVLHDENGNGKADMMLGIPREGIGFSQNPVLRMRPPTFAEARFHVGDKGVAETIRLKYFL